MAAVDAFAMRELAPELADVAHRFFDEGWIDAPIRPGKRPGAFCAYTVPGHHPYVLLNWTGKRRDVMTLAHELGHVVEAFIMQGGVATDFIQWRADDGIGRSVRNGLNFTERGFGIRGAVGNPDRGNTAASQLKPGDIDWDHIFGKLGVRWFHTGGIFAALSATTAELTVEAVKAANVEAVFVPGYYTEVALIARQARSLGLTIPLFGGDGWESEKLLEIGGDSLNGTYYSTHFTPENREPAVVEFVKKFKARWSNETPDAYAALGYDALYILVDAIRRSGVTEGPKLREAIAAKFQRENGLTYKPSQVIVSCGGKHSCYNVILATCEAGDEVIIPSPYWLSYPEMVKLAGAKPVIIETTDKTEFKVTPEQLRAAITSNTRLFVLNSPSNPTGSVYTPDEIKALGDICVEKGVLIMSDEIYEHLTYDGAVVKSVASFSQAHQDHTIIVHGFAKAWSMTGWRLGFLAAPEPIAKAIDAVQSHSTSNPTSFAQKGAVAALTGPQDHLKPWLAEFSKRRSFAHQKLNSIPGITCVNAKGAFYLFPNISKLGLKSSEFCAKLLEQEKVAAVPGIAFGADDYIRLSYATSMANIEKGLDRLDRFVRSLK